VKHLIIVTTVLLVGAVQSQAQTEPAKDKAPDVKSIDVKKGDQWVYTARDELTGEVKATVSHVVSDVADNEIDVRVISKAPSGAEGTFLETYDRRWRKTEGAKFKFSKGQEFWGVPEDIAVGKEWSYSYEMRSLAGPLNFKWAGHGEVTAWEKVLLPSGQSFDAYKIEFHEATSRNAGSQIEIVTEATPANLNVQSSVVEWYAPSVNRYVKRTFEYRQKGKLLTAESETLTKYARRESE
jgi:hypothetical protein